MSVPKPDHVARQEQYASPKAQTSQSRLTRSSPRSRRMRFLVLALLSIVLVLSLYLTSAAARSGARAGTPPKYSIPSVVIGGCPCSVLPDCVCAMDFPDSGQETNTGEQISDAH